MTRSSASMRGYGQSDQQGVMGLSTSDSGTGVYGGGAKQSGAPGSDSIGVRGETFTGVGVQGRSFGSGLAGKFIGNVEVNGFLTVNGTTINTQIDVFKNEIEGLRQEIESLRAVVVHQPPQPQPQPPTKPTISVSSSGSGPNAAFTVTGSGFTRGATVRVRIVDDAQNERDQQASADGQGA